MATASTKNERRPRGQRYVRITAPAKLVAAWPEGMDWPTVAPMSVSTGNSSKGRGRPVAVLIPRAMRSADQTHAAVSPSPKNGFRFASRLTGTARATQTRPA